MAVINPDSQPTASITAKAAAIEVTENTVHLAIETTGSSGSLAILKGPNVVSSITMGGETRTAAALAPTLNGLISKANLGLDQIDFVSVAHGPGSFTGLRIGVTTAKTLCYARSIPLIAVDSLAAIAATTFYDHASIQRVLVGVNAYRGQVFTASIARSESQSGSQVEILDQTSVMEQEQWNERLQSIDSQNVHFVGDQKVFRKFFEARIAEGAEDDLADRLIERRSVDAGGTGLLGIAGAAQSAFCDPMQLVPKYLKVSAAEEKLL